MEPAEIIDVLPLGAYSVDTVFPALELLLGLEFRRVVSSDGRTTMYLGAITRGGMFERECTLPPWFYHDLLPASLEDVPIRVIRVDIRSVTGRGATGTAISDNTRSSFFGLQSREQFTSGSGRRSIQGRTGNHGSVASMRRSGSIILVFRQMASTG